MTTVADLYRMLDRLIARLDPAPDDRVTHLLDYTHAAGGVLFHATLSDGDGPVRSTWTYEDGGEVVTRDFPLGRTDFDRLWVGVQRLPVFNRLLCNDMARPVDPGADHVLSYVYSEPGGYGRGVFLVPAAEPDRAFRVWLDLLGGPPGRDTTPEHP